MPLTLRSSLWWSALIFGVTMMLGVGLPTLATQVAGETVPPGGNEFGNASVVPAEGWTETDQSANSLTLSKNGIRISFTSVPADGESAAVRALELADENQAQYPALTVASDPRTFNTTQGPGELIALAGTSLTAIVASVVVGAEAVDIQTRGESTQFGEIVGDIQDMLESIRIQAAPDGL